MSEQYKSNADNAPHAGSCGPPQDPDHPPAPPAAPAPPSDDGRRTLGQFLRFFGLLMTAGGSLAVIRLSRAGTRDAFIALLLPLGLVIWYVGLRIESRARR